MTVSRAGDQDFVDWPGRRTADPLAGQATQSSARLVELRRETDRTAHRHPHSEEVIYVISGTGYVWVDGDQHRVAAGDVVSIPAGAAHATVPDGGQTMRLMCFFPHPDLAANLVETDIPVVRDQPQ